MIQPITSNVNNYQNLNAQMQLPSIDRNYCLFNQAKVDYFVSQKEKSIPYLEKVLSNSKNEKDIVEALYITDRLIDSGEKNVGKMYPVLSKFNDSDSPNIQTFLAGIYRKTQVPDAFGPLLSMLIRNTFINNNKQNFDPNEEIGGAILDYIRNNQKNS